MTKCMRKLCIHTHTHTVSHTSIRSNRAWNNVLGLGTAKQIEIDRQFALIALTEIDVKLLPSSNDRTRAELPQIIVLGL